MDDSADRPRPEQQSGEAVQLFGRELERAAVSRLLENARRGHSGVLVLRGEAGIGKSALFDFALSRASGVRILRGVGVEPESELAFSGLYQLLHPVFSFIDKIPPVQAEALRSALGIAPGQAENRFVIALAVLSLLAEVAAEGAVLCVIDDAQWLDHSSADALAFVARRLEAEGIVMLFGVREGEPRSFPGSGLPERAVGGLDPAEAERLLVDRFGAALAPEIRHVIVEAAQGNPLALLEIPEELTGAQLAGREALPRPMPIGRDLEKILLERVHRLPGPVQMLLLVAAAEGSGEADIVLSAGSAIGIPPSTLLDAEASGLVRTEGTALVFRHPILRSAIYQGASLPQRQAAHRALVEVLPEEPNADRRAWHRAALVLYPDDEIADELERTADRARSRSGHAAASRALRRAAELTSSDEGRARRLASAARAAWDAGQPADAAALLLAAETETDADTYAELRHVRGEIDFRCGNPLDGARVLMDGAERVTRSDPDKALQMLFDAALCANYGGDLTMMIEAARRASELPIKESEPEAPLVDLLGDIVTMIHAQDTSVRPRLVGALDRLADSTEPRWLFWASAAAGSIGDQAREDALIRHAEAIARRSMAAGTLAMVLERTTWTDMLYGRIAAASLHSEEGLQLAMETGLTNMACWHQAILAWVAAARGDEESCTSLAERASETATMHSLTPHNTIANWAMGLLHLGLGNWESAATRLEDVASPAPGMGHPYVAWRALPDLVEAAVRADRPDVAEMAASRFADHTREGAPDWQKALAARCGALITQTPEEKERLLSEALLFHGRDARPFNRARTLLLLGEHLRRERRRKEARKPLQAALDVFEQAGASPWAERATRELRATGQTVRRRDVGSSRELTFQERRVVGMVAEGASNKEVAAQLFLSPRTVEYHLRSVFSKLGIASRAELIRLRLEEASSNHPG